MKPAWHRNRVVTSRAGFTLTELMVVVAIIATLAAVLTPSVATYMRQSRGRSAARAVASKLRQARQEAMSRGQVVLVDVQTQAAGDNGQITVSRTKRSDSYIASNAECDPEDADYDPSATNCFAMSCAQAQGFETETISNATLDLAQAHPNMIISGIDATPAAVGNSLRLCFAPGGRVLTSSGVAFGGGCNAVNVRIFVRSAETQGSNGYNDNPLSDDSTPLLNGCMDSDDDDDADKRQDQKDGRSLENFYSIRVPYNGAISAVQ